MIAEQNPEIRKAVDTLYEISADDKVRAEYEMRQKAWRDRMSQFDGYYQDGMQKGMQHGRMEGLEEGQRKILELLKSGKSPEEIMRAYGGTM
jgi:predicted transposase/invertase (TIGR01784 family)